MKILKILLALVIIALLILILKYCCKQEPPTPSPSKFYGYNIKLENESVSGFKSRLEAGLGIPLTDETFYVCPCDTTLVNLRLDSVSIEGHGPAAVRTRTGAVGLDMMYGKNYELVSETDTLPAEFIRYWLGNLVKQSENPKQPNDSNGFEWNGFNPFPLTTEEGTSTSAENIVAIFDAGIHQDFNSLPYQNVLGINAASQSELCGPQISVSPNIHNRIMGVNHIHEETGIIDYGKIWDHSSKQHGSKVTQLLATQRIGQAAATPLRILTMRVLNNENKGDLFSLMCAMSQARKLGANIFNMSLGYYGPLDSLFQKHLNTLAEKNIWVVTAAGNATSTSETGASDLSINRDLELRPDTSKFYPAYFSKEMKHVIAVTTISNTPGRVCDLQNYGKDVVDVGVLGDNCSFTFGANGTYVNIQGTSYATPIVAGWLAGKQNLSSFTDKADLLNDLPTDPALIDKIKGKRYLKANGY